jgi:hypothetical protein
MSTYLKGGEEFYGFAEAAQDHYLSLLIKKALVEDETIESSNQPWAIE